MIDLPRIKPGDPMRADDVNKIIDALRMFTVTGPNVLRTPHGFHIRQLNSPQTSGGSSGGLTEVFARLTAATYVRKYFYLYDWEEVYLAFSSDASGPIVTPTPVVGGRTSLDQISYGDPFPQDTQGFIITAPTPYSKLAGTSVTFVRNTLVGFNDIRLYVGKTLGGSEYYASPSAMSTSQPVSGLPNDGSAVYVRIYSRRTNGATYNNDYWYEAAGGIGNKAINLRALDNDDTRVWHVGINPSRDAYAGMTLDLQPSGGVAGDGRSYNRMPLRMFKIGSVWCFEDTNGIEVTCG